MYVLEQAIWREQFPEETEKQYIDFIKAELAPRYAEFIGKEIQKAYLESYSEYGQNLFDRYVAYADAWVEDQDFKDSDTGQLLDRKLLDQELSKIEKPAGSPTRRTSATRSSSSRCERADQQRQEPVLDVYEKIREVIERRMFSQVEDLLPVISFSTRRTATRVEAHRVRRPHGARGYTERQVRRLVEWYMRVKQGRMRASEAVP